MGFENGSRGQLVGSETLALSRNFQSLQTILQLMKGHSIQLIKRNTREWISWLAKSVALWCPMVSESHQNIVYVLIAGSYLERENLIPKRKNPMGMDNRVHTTSV
ncbi:MAG: hypothetical protein P1Q69_14905 [Candidatus Thorarchaeota archaeon]|nr:hypothetical protein [Candidatus Thorarchaeota archaeon]